MKRNVVSTLGRIARSAALPLAALAIPAVAIPSVASAQRGGSQREVFEWRGNVDQEVRIQMRGGRTSTMAMGPHEMTAYDQARAFSAMPSTDGYLNVQVLQGRGRVDVVQQPSSQNGYTAIVRVRDPQTGSAPYDIAAYWEPTGNYGYGSYGNGNYGNGNYGAYGRTPVYGRAYPNGGVVQQPVYQGGKQLPGTAQNTGVYGRTYPYPNGTVQPRMNPNGKVLPGQAQSAHERGRGHRKHDRDRDQNDQNGQY